jgi:hypothetical protein
VDIYDITGEVNFHYADEDAAECGCQGRGWLLTPYDTWVRCSMHSGPHPEERTSAEEEEQYGPASPPEWYDD